MHGEPQYYHRPAGYRYANDDEGYWYPDRQAPAAWEYWDDEDDAGRADSATGGPLVILTSLAVIGTGVMLALAGPRHLAARAQGGVRAVVRRHDHPRAGVSLAAAQAGRQRPDPRADQVLGGRAARWLLLTASLLAGLLLAVITVHLAGPWAAVPGPGR